jgi:large exoprotein involved in heme utilization and adhesion
VIAGIGTAPMGFGEVSYASGIYSSAGQGTDALENWVVGFCCVGGRGSGSTGSAGSVRITAGTLNISDGATIQTRTEGSGGGGSLNISARSIRLSNGGMVNAESIGTKAAAGTGGSITITAGDTLRLDRSTIQAQTASASGGDATLTAGRLFDLHNSSVTTSVAGGTGSGGNIFINSSLMVLDGNRIEANAQRGAGGNITIQAGQLIRTPHSVIQASSAQSVSGNITINAPSTDVAGSLVALPETLFDASSQLRVACAARGGRPASSFNAGGRGGLPPDPGTPLAASPFEQSLEQQTATAPSASRTPQAAKPITLSGIPQPVLGSPRLTCRG